MKKIFIFVCMILGSCAFIGCNGNGTAQSGENDSVAVDSDSIVVDSAAIDTISADSICLE
jgi:hypothetical protein